jgi:hypothetical protein
MVEGEWNDISQVAEIAGQLGDEMVRKTSCSQPEGLLCALTPQNRNDPLNSAQPQKHAQPLLQPSKKGAANAFVASLRRSKGRITITLCRP